MTDLEFFRKRSKVSKNDWLGGIIGGMKSCETRKEARRFYLGYIDHLMKEYDMDFVKAEGTVRGNLGYCYGEGLSDDKIKLWFDATLIRHPWVPDLGFRDVSPKELFDVGMARGEKLRQENEQVR